MCAVTLSTEPGVHGWFTGPSVGWEGGTDGGVKGQNQHLAITDVGEVLVPFVTSLRAD